MIVLSAQSAAAIRFPSVTFNDHTVHSFTGRDGREGGLELGWMTATPRTKLYINDSREAEIELNEREEDLKKKFFSGPQRSCHVVSVLILTNVLFHRAVSEAIHKHARKEH